jgi:hypothetical protein
MLIATPAGERVITVEFIPAPANVIFLGGGIVTAVLQVQAPAGT